MKLLLIYGTTKGQTAKIAAHIARTLRNQGNEVELLDGRSIPTDLDLARYAGIVVGASVNAGRFQPYILTFVQTHREQIQRMPSAFFSVSLTEADPDPKRHARVMHPITRMQAKTGWQPEMIASFAGSIAYLRYRWIMRLMWRRLPLPEPRGRGPLGGLSATDYEYTDWDAVTPFAEAFSAKAHVGPRERVTV